MEKFVEFFNVDVLDSEWNLEEVSIYAQTESGSLIHVRDYDCYDKEVSFTTDDEGKVVFVYSANLSLIILNGRLFEITYDRDGRVHDFEVTMPMLLANAN